VVLDFCACEFGENVTQVSRKVRTAKSVTMVLCHAIFPGSLSWAGHANGSCLTSEVKNRQLYQFDTLNPRDLSNGAVIRV